GKEMLSLALRYAFEILRVTKVSLNVFENNESAYFCYKALGFKEAEETSETCQIMGESWTRLRMEIARLPKAQVNLDTSHLLKRDLITGMYNQQGFMEQLEQWKEQYIDSGEQIMLVSVDIDRLGNINDIYGHSEGDVAIQTLATIIDDCLSEHEICAHLGSDEFVVAMHVATGGEDQIFESLIHAIVGRIENYNRVSEKEYSLEVNYSYTAVVPEPDMKMQAVLDSAFANKRIDKNNRRGYQATEGGAEENYNPAEEKMVNTILDENRFRYAFQPIVDAKTGDIYAYEALMRAELDGPVSPFIVLKYATKGHRLYDIERATFFNVFKEVSEKINLFEDKKIFINSIPGYQLDDADFQQLRRKYAGLLKQVVVEITEQTELDDSGLETMLQRSADDGFGIAIDDYGTGYSNTSSLLRYLPNCVKIDRLLITNIQEDPKKQHFVKSIIEFGHDNGFHILAEGVETAGELRAVIHMGADLIQGYYTAKPSLEVLQEIDPEIKNEIVSVNLDTAGKAERKIFMVTSEKELPLVRLALEQYTGILLSQGDLTLVGNPEYVAGVTIKIKDGSTCRLTLKNVRLESLLAQPCIDIGEDAHLTIVLEGDNELNEVGIRVPEGSSLHIEGSGNLSVRAKGVTCYGIGNGLNAGVGSIVFASSGALKIWIEGARCIGIDGGIHRSGDGVKIAGGSITIGGACENIIGIGCVEGAMPIDIGNCRLEVETNVAKGIGIGCLNGDQNIRIASSRLDIIGSGNNLCGIGSTEKTGGVIHISTSKVIVKINGQKVRLIGNAGGELYILTEESRLELTSEGSLVSGIGSMEKTAIIKGRHATYVINIHAGQHAVLGAKEENISFDGGERLLKINED
ncbi:MAG: EAL domain-containing protein, partial [Lachnospiraceae bacterium]|nr:EAL domain-containing protein [Lachnospiraceae bacterium]